jgi:hypothetical protein
MKPRPEEALGSGSRGPRCRAPSPAVILIVIVVLTIRPAPVVAHFMLSSNIRVIHVEPLERGLRVYLRLPMPLIVADLVGPGRADGTAEPAPYTVNRIENGQLAHYLDVEAFRRDPIGLGRLAARRHALVADDRLLESRVEAVRAYPAFKQARFSNLAEARAALQGPAYADGLGTIYAGETVVDVQLLYPIRQPVTRYYAFGARVSPALAGAESLANVLFDHRGAEPRIFRALGPLATPFVVSRTAGAAAAASSGPSGWWKESIAFVWQGIVHILGGPDHLLFVLCLTIGARGLQDLLMRITGFTLGHTVTLVAGFLGFAPAVPWFVPAIETAIALSIIYAGAVALGRRTGSDTFVVTAAIGLLHGFGFSFVLTNILQADAPNLWARLLSFNLGVEIGQVVLILAIWPVLRFLERSAPRYAPYGRAAVVAPAIAVAAVWSVERIRVLWERVAL